MANDAGKDFGWAVKPVGSTAHDHMCRCPACAARYRPVSCALCDRCRFDMEYGRCVYGGPYRGLMREGQDG